MAALFIVIANTTRIPIDFGITTGVSIQEPRLLQARGSIFNARFSDRKSPIAYGYDETMPIYFNQAPLFQVATGVPGGGGGGGGGWRRRTGRPTGRGSLDRSRTLCRECRWLRRRLVRVRVQARSS